jgi:hypothetical protein
LIVLNLWYLTTRSHTYNRTKVSMHLSCCGTFEIPSSLLCTTTRVETLYELYNTLECYSEPLYSNLEIYCWQ